MAVGVLVPALMWGAASRAGAAAARPEVRRVLVLSLPGTTWADLAGARTPNLQALLRDSAVGNTSVRAIERQTRPGDGYATIGAGTAAAGVAKVEGLAFDTDEVLPPGSDVEAYRRRSPVTAADGDVVTVAIADLARNARHRHRGAEIGALGEALARLGVARGVVGNADTALAAGDPATYHREAALALADHAGVVPAGEVGRGLLREEGGWPLGLRLDPDATLGAFRTAWRVPGRAVVLVEASDLARLHVFERGIPPDRRPDPEMGHRILEATDGLIGRVLSDVDPDHDAVIVTAPSDPGDGVHLTVGALRAPGVGPGLLDSATTRRAGYVTLPDLGPTVLQLLGLPRPDSMEGRPYEVRPRARAGPPVGRFVEDDREARFRDRMVGPVAGVYVTLQILLSLAVALFLARGARRPGARRAFDFVGLWLLAVVPLTFLGAVLDLHTVGPYLALVIG
ncbi:MAG TPA: hypothetical protein VGR20_25050, partial [Acidimicrobiia bacterium]|nr:hypothetical protein [Acidimicrobiia bacterium]